MGQATSPLESPTNRKSPFATPAPAPVLVNVNSGSSGAFILPGGLGSEMTSSLVNLSTYDEF